MAYKKVYYKEIWDRSHSIQSACKSWQESVQNFNKNTGAFVQDSDFKGEGADGIKAYFSDVHNKLPSWIISLTSTFALLAIDYYGHYKLNVDKGSGKGSGEWHTTFVSDEIKPGGTVDVRFQGYMKIADFIRDEANRISGSVSDLVSLPRINDDSIINTLKRSVKYATDVDKKIDSYESGLLAKLESVKDLLTQINSIINYQLSDQRIPMANYQSGGIGIMCDPEKLNECLERCRNISEEIQNTDYFEEACNLVVNHDTIIADIEQAEAEEARQWVKWVAVGVAVVGGIVLTVVTAGTAGPGVCIAVGALVGGVTAASSKLADEYVKNGNLDNMDWGDFTTEVIAGAVVGGIAGGFGAVSQGSAIKGPIQAGWNVAKQKIVEEGADCLVRTGCAVVLGPPEGETVLSVLSKEAKDIAVKGAGGFVGGTVAGNFAVDTSDKNYLTKLGEKTIENAAKYGTEGTVKTVWDVADYGIIRGDMNACKSALYDDWKGTLGDFVGDEASGVVSQHTGKNHIKGWGKIGDTITDTASDTAKSVFKGVTERTVDAAAGKGTSEDILGKVWEDDLDGGRKLAKSAADNTVKNVAKEKIELRKLDRADGKTDGKINTVDVGDRKVAQQDYDAARENAGKGAFKDKTVEDLLGIDKDVDRRSAVRNQTDISDMKKYSDGRKTVDTVTVKDSAGKQYVFKKSDYDDARAVEAKGGQSAKSRLDLPKDVDLDNATTKRVKKEDFGTNKKVEPHWENKSNVKKYNITGEKK